MACFPLERSFALGKNLFKLLVSIARASLGAAVLGMLGWICFDKESSSYGDAALWYQRCRLGFCCFTGVLSIPKPRESQIETSCLSAVSHWCPWHPLLHILQPVGNIQVPGCRWVTPAVSTQCRGAVAEPSTARPADGTKCFSSFL